MAAIEVMSAAKSEDIVRRLAAGNLVAHSKDQALQALSTVVVAILDRMEADDNYEREQNERR